jgi:hypothetical protein
MRLSNQRCFGVLPSSRRLVQSDNVPLKHRRSNKTDKIGVRAGRLQRRNGNAIFSFGNNFDAGCASKAGEYGRGLCSTSGIIFPFIRERGPFGAIDPVWICGPATRGGCGIRAAYAQARIGVGHPGRCRGRRVQTAACIAPGIGDRQAARRAQRVVLAHGNRETIAGIGGNRDLLAAFVEGIGT